MLNKTVVEFQLFKVQNMPHTHEIYFRPDCPRPAAALEFVLRGSRDRFAFRVKWDVTESFCERKKTGRSEKRKDDVEESGGKREGQKILFSFYI